MNINGKSYFREDAIMFIICHVGYKKCPVAQYYVKSSIKSLVAVRNIHGGNFEVQRNNMSLSISISISIYICIHNYNLYIHVSLLEVVLSKVWSINRSV